MKSGILGVLAAISDEEVSFHRHFEVPLEAVVHFLFSGHSQYGMIDRPGSKSKESRCTYLQALDLGKLARGPKIILK